MSLKIFVTGTDTNVGKTYISVSLLKIFNQLGYSTLGIKPIASGSSMSHGKLQNEDALALQKTSSVKLDYDQINPYAFEPSISPHIAGNNIGVALDVETVANKIRPALELPVDVQIIEGVGGWCVPLNKQESMADLVKHLNLSVILTVGIKLGCLNHSILTAKAIANSGLPFIGWIANCVEPATLEIHENIATLKQWLPAPCLGIVHYQQKPEESLSLVDCMFTAP
jgi:dethiobiotin synthetase